MGLVARTRIIDALDGVRGSYVSSSRYLPIAGIDVCPVRVDLSNWMLNPGEAIRTAGQERDGRRPSTVNRGADMPSINLSLQGRFDEQGRKVI